MEGLPDISGHNEQGRVHSPRWQWMMDMSLSPLLSLHATLQTEPLAGNTFASQSNTPRVCGLIVSAATGDKIRSQQHDTAA